MLPVIGSKSYTDDMSSSLSITSPSIISITARSLGGSGLIREPLSLALTERVESPAVTPETRSETRRPPVPPGEAATSQMLALERREEKGRGGEEEEEERVLSEWRPGKKKGALWFNCPCSVNEIKNKTKMCSESR